MNRCIAPALLKGISLAACLLLGPAASAQIRRVPWINHTDHPVLVDLSESGKHLGYLIFCDRDDNAGSTQNLGKDTEVTLVRDSVKLNPGNTTMKMAHKVTIPAHSTKWVTYNRETAATDAGKIALEFAVTEADGKAGITFTIAGERGAKEGEVQPAKIKMGGGSVTKFVPKIKTLARTTLLGENASLEFLKPAP